MLIPDLDGILDVMNNGWDPFKNFSTLDTNKDGYLSKSDCPFEFGSPDAQIWWDTVMEPYLKSNVTEQMREQYGEDVVGAWKGKPLIPGKQVYGQGDLDYLVDKVRVTKGLEWDSARAVATKVYVENYLGG